MTVHTPPKFHETLTQIESKTYQSDTITFHDLGLDDESLIRLCTKIEQSQLGNIHTIELTGNHFTVVGLEALRKIPNLTTLNLSYNKLKEDAGRVLVQLKKLVSLDVSSNQLGDEGTLLLSQSKALEYLNLSNNNKISDNAAFHLTGMTQLKELNLGFNAISLEGAKALCHLENLKRLYIHFNKLNREERKSIAHHLCRSFENPTSSLYSL